MLEIGFSDSAKASLTIAKRMAPKTNAEGQKGQYHIPAEDPFGENPEDVVCIGYCLDIGDIAGDIDSDERKKEFRRIFASVEFEDNEVEEFFRSQKEDLHRMLTAAKSGERLRVWKSDAPFSSCGFAYLCDMLRDIECDLHVIELPALCGDSDDTVQTCSEWAELPPEKLHEFLPFERKIFSAEKISQSNLWRELKKDNASLRASVNGRLLSVPEDFYDHIIIRNIPECAFVMAQLIGSVLGKYPLGVSDGWYALRIKKMIAEHRLEIIGETDPTHPYGKILQKATGTRRTA